MAEGPKKAGRLARYGAKLLENGYEIIPIRPGEKRPRGNDWQTNPLNPKSLRIAAASSPKDGVGVLTRTTPAIDIDVKDEGMAAAMEAFILDLVGSAPIRIGDYPKRLLVFRAGKGFRKVMSKDWIDPENPTDRRGKPARARVEILAEGQQFVAYHVHPDTKQPYKWTAQSLVDIPHDDLPRLSLADAQTICREFDDLAGRAGWAPFRKGGTSLSTMDGDFDDDDWTASVKEKTDLTFEQLAEMTMLVPHADDYETWVQVGMALHHQTEGAEEGLKLWHEWSEGADNYEPEALDFRWNGSFNEDRSDRPPLTARIIIKWAHEHQATLSREALEDVKQKLTTVDDVPELRAICDTIKQTEFDSLTRTQLIHNIREAFKKMTGAALPIGEARAMVRYENREIKSDQKPRWLENWIFCEKEVEFYNTEDRTALEVASFNLVMAKHLMTLQDRFEGKPRPDAAPADVAMNIYQIPTVFSREYAPGEPIFFDRDGVSRVNTYDDRDVPVVPEDYKPNRKERQAIERVKAHFPHLFEDERDRRLLLDWIAWIVQNPGKHPNWAILAQGVEGDGKSLFNMLLHAVLGPQNVDTLFAAALEEKNTAWAEGHQLVFVEEIKLHGHSRFAILDKFKPLITNPMVSIRRMNVDWYKVPNRTSYFLTTNYLDALPLTDNDSRYFILLSRFRTLADLRAFKTRNPSYYTDLMDAIQENGTALRWWLLNHELSDEFDPGDRAPHSSGKSEMVMNSKSEEAAALETILEENPREDVSSTLLRVSALDALFDDQGTSLPDGRALAGLLAGYGFTSLGQVRVDGGERDRFWSRTPAKFKTKGRTDPAKIRAFLSDAL